MKEFKNEQDNSRYLLMVVYVLLNTANGFNKGAFSSSEELIKSEKFLSKIGSEVLPYLYCVANLLFTLVFGYIYV